MAIQFTVKVTDQSGGIFGITHILGNAEINIEAIAGQTFSGFSRISFLTNNPPKAAEVLNNHKIPFEQVDVIVVKLQNVPGQTAIFTKALGDAGISIRKFYLTMNGEEVLDTDDFLGSKKVADDFGVFQSK